MAVQFDIPYPPGKSGRSAWSRRFGLNAYYAGKCWQLRKMDADFWHDLVAVEMQRQHVRDAPFEDAVYIEMAFHDRLDIDNHAIYAKMIIDAMKGRVIADDDRQHVRGLTMKFHTRDCIRVTVREEDYRREN